MELKEFLTEAEEWFRNHANNKDDEGKFNFDKKEMVETFLKEQQPEDPKFKKKVEANESLNESINSLDILIEQIKNEILI